MRCCVTPPAQVSTALILPFPSRTANTERAAHLTARAVDALNYSRLDHKLQFVWDAKMVGLGIRLTPAGHKAYVVRYRVNGRQRLATVGDVHVHSLDDARKTARSILAKADTGVDAQAERERIAAAGTTADAWSRYVTDRLSKRATSTLANYELLWRVHIQQAFARIPIIDITQTQVDQWHREVTLTRGPYVANRAFETLRGTINWQIKRYRYALPVGFVNPCYGVEKNKERPRRTILRPADRPALAGAIAAEADPVVRAFFWMCLYTGARKGELLGLTWDRVHLDSTRRRGEIKFSETKNGNPHTVPLSADAARVMREMPRAEGSAYVFPHRDTEKARVNVNKAWGRIRAKAGQPSLRIHDLRRSVGSWLGASGCTAEMIGALLNHRSNITSKVYVQLGELDVKRALVDKGARLLRGALKGRRRDH
jgi:integrase